MLTSLLTPMDNEAGQNGEGFKVSFIINAVVGTLALMLMLLGFALESVYPVVQGEIAWGFAGTVLICYAVAGLHYAKYRNLHNSGRR